MFLCKDLYQLTSFSSAKVIAGRQGMSNSIRWAYKVEEMEFGKWIKGRELLVISNGIAKNAEFCLEDIIKTAIRHHTAGALLLTGKGYVEEISPQVITLANRYSFPVFTMQWNAVPLVELFEELGHAIALQDSIEGQKDDVLANIIFGSSDRFGEQLLISKMKKYGIQAPYRIFVIHFFTDKAESLEREYIVSKLNEICGQYKIPVLLTKYGSNYVGLLHAGQDDVLLWDKLKEQIDSFVHREYPEWAYMIGIGQSYKELKQMQICFKEATRCISLSHKLKKRDHLLFYDQLGLYNLFLGIENEEILSQYCRQLLGKLIAYDQENESELILTLRHHLEANCNIMETSKRMYIHRNTIKYRLQRIEEITGKNLNETMHRTCFQTAIMIHDYLEEES